MPDAAKNRRAWLGVDVGGSNSLAVLYDDDWNRIARHKMDTEAAKGVERSVARIRRQIEKMREKARSLGHEIAAVGAGVPAPVRPDGTVEHAPNLGWKNIAPAGLLGADLVVNDVNAGLAGEMLHLEPEFRDRTVVAYFCGTGIGGALWIRGGLFTGAQGGAGEVGHMRLGMGGGRHAGFQETLEGAIGKRGLHKIIQRHVKKNRKTLLRKDGKKDEGPVRSSLLKKAWLAGDKFAHSLMKEHYCPCLAVGVSQTVNLLNPDLVLLGGGVMEALGKRLLPLVRDELAKHCINPPPELRLAALGDYAGPLGAAWLARSALDAAKEGGA